MVRFTLLDLTLDILVLVITLKERILSELYNYHSEFPHEFKLVTRTFFDTR